jgi:hypothetical protein
VEKLVFSVTLRLQSTAYAGYVASTAIALYSYIKKNELAKAKVFPHLEAWVQRT